MSIIDRIKSMRSKSRASGDMQRQMKEDKIKEIHNKTQNYIDQNSLKDSDHQES